MKLVYALLITSLTASAIRNMSYFPGSFPAVPDPSFTWQEVTQRPQTFFEGMESAPRKDTGAYTIPLGGNSWITAKDASAKAEVTNEGWRNWQSLQPPADLPDVH